jgi:hypothetical protein
MAPLSASGKPISASRKKLVQPVLPALPKKFDIKAAPPVNSLPPPEIVNVPIANERPAHIAAPLKDEEDVVTKPPAAADPAVELISNSIHESGESFKFTSSHSIHLIFTLEARETTQKAATSFAEQEQLIQGAPRIAEAEHTNPEDPPESIEVESGENSVLAAIGPTQENIQSIESELYESNKMQEWADHVKDDSNQSTYSANKDTNVNGVASTDELPQSISAASNQGPDVSSKSSTHDTSGLHSSYLFRYPDPVKDGDFEVAAPRGQLALPAMTEHLLNMEKSKDFADWAIVVNFTGMQPLVAYAHGLILFRSPRMAALMRQARATAYGSAYGSAYSSAVINLYPPRAIIPGAFDAALRFLYTDSLLAEDYNVPKAATPPFRQARLSALNNILSYWVASIELGLPPVAARALRHLESLLNWDVAELVLKEMDDILFASTQPGEVRPDDDGYVSAAMKLKKLVIQFVARQVAGGDFRIDTTSTPSLMRSRFHAIDDARTRHNPVLATMVFGSMPSSADLSPSSPQSESLPIASSFENQVASNILLNIDFFNLEIFSHELRNIMGADALPILQDIVDEREIRRVRVVNNRDVPNKMRIANSAAWEVAGLKEYLHDGSLRSERVGFLPLVRSK